MKIKAHVIKRAAKLFESFHERKPKTIKTIQFSIPNMVAGIGHVEEIGYRVTDANGQSVYYKHPFDPGSRPYLCVSPDGKQLMLVGGRYQFTEQGIVDKDSNGRLITDPKHGKRLNRSG